MPVVSIIIPVYNAHDFIDRSIQSALKQTLRDIEVIVVDDCSTDGTADAVAQHAAQDSRLTLLKQATNQGPSAARNAGIAAARGQWIAILDADDWYDPERLMIMSRAGASAGADMVSDNLLLFDETAGAMIGPMFAAGELAPSIDGACFVTGNLPDPHKPRRGHGFLKPIMRREFLARHQLRYNEEMRFAEDYVFYLDALLAGAKWISIPTATYIYSVRSSSLTARHTATDLFKLCAADERALQRARGNPPLQKALKRHLVSTQKRAAWAHFINLFKERRAAELLHTATMNTQVFGYILKQCLHQVIVRSSRRAGLRLIEY